MCLSIFSDFAQVHTEWAKEEGTGWSPSYTVQTVLLNLIAFLEQCHDGCWPTRSKLTKAFSCPDCGHTPSKPYPPFLDQPQGVLPKAIHPDLTCYATKELYDPSSDAVWGFGVARNGTPQNPQLTSPCEFMTLDGFQQLAVGGQAESVMREKLAHFVPLVIGRESKLFAAQFEKSMLEISGYKDLASACLFVLPKLLNSTVVTFMNGKR